MKKLVTIAVLSALSMAAHAEVDIYGKVRVGLENGKANNQSELQADGTRHKQSGLEDWGTYIGFKGQESLGDGLKALWQIEQSVDITGDSQFANRESFVGVDAGVATVKLGRLNNVTKSEFGAADKWEYGTGVNGLRNFGRFDGQVNNAVRVDSSVVPGLKLSALYGFDKTREYVGTERQNNNTVNLAATYDLGNDTWVGYGYMTQKGVGDGNVKSKVHRVEAGTAINGVTLAAAYQDATTGLGVNGTSVSGLYTGGSTVALNTALNGATLTDGKVKTKEFALTASYELGKWTPKFTYAHGNDAKVDGFKAEGTGYDQFVIGADYSFSKRTTAQFAYGQVKSDAQLAGTKTENTVSVGLVHNF